MNIMKKMNTRSNLISNLKIRPTKIVGVDVAAIPKMVAVGVVVELITILKTKEVASTIKKISLPERQVSETF